MLTVREYRNLLNMAEFSQGRIGVNWILNTVRQAAGAAASSSARLVNNLTSSGDLLKLFELFDDSTRASISGFLSQINNADDYNKFLKELENVISSSNAINARKKKQAFNILSRLKSKEMPDIKLVTAFQKGDEVSKKTVQQFSEWASASTKKFLTNISRELKVKVESLDDLDYLMKIGRLNNDQVERVIGKTFNETEGKAFRKMLSDSNLLPPASSATASTKVGAVASELDDEDVYVSDLFDNKSKSTKTSSSTGAAQQQGTNQPYQESASSPFGQQPFASKGYQQIEDDSDPWFSPPSKGYGTPYVQTDSPFDRRQKPNQRGDSSNKGSSGGFFQNFKKSPDLAIASGATGLGLGIALTAAMNRAKMNEINKQQDELRQKQSRRFF
ncbi:MAG: hypothetical protein D6735_04220 [Acidobacteria bacterium]|nr:MAG: hypothetical protein D6735_04220 [Acidobacteriota bacterium]